MTEAEYLASADPVAMLAQFVPPGGRSSRAGHNLNSFPTTDRKLRLFACACCRQVWHLLTDDAPCGRCGGSGKVGRSSYGGDCPDCGGTGRVNRSRRAVEVAERYADEGESVAKEMERAWLYLDMESPHDPVWLAAYLACCPPDTLARQLVEHSARLSRIIPPAAQASLLRCLFGNPWRPVPPSRFELGDSIYTYGRYAPTVRTLARAAYDDRDFSALPILADALEEAGATDPDLLGHLRGDVPCGRCGEKGVVNFVGETEDGEPCHGGRTVCPDCGGTGRLPAPHARGCWALDLLLGLS